jgi:CAAX prenyl protease-like protein
MTWPPRRAILARAAPFAVFMVLLAARGYVPQGVIGFDPQWLYAASVVLVGGVLAYFWRDYGELSKQVLPDAREVVLAVAAGVVVFALWIHLDAAWMVLGEPTAAFVPVTPDGRLQWPLIAIRWVGAALLVPVMEELFWRSFLMRWIQDQQFEAVAPARVGLKAIALSTFVFMLAHVLWLAAIIAGVVYAALYIRTGKLWVAVIAHAVTNGVLGVWVVMSKSWVFW